MSILTELCESLREYPLDGDAEELPMVASSLEAPTADQLRELFLALPAASRKGVDVNTILLKWRQVRGSLRGWALEWNGGRSRLIFTGKGDPDWLRVFPVDGLHTDDAMKAYRLTMRFVKMSYPAGLAGRV